MPIRLRHWGGGRPVVRLGVLVNPDAGLGGRLGFKGSDGRADEARAAGAEERSGPRMNEALGCLFSRLSSQLKGGGVADDVVFLTSGGNMGADWLPEEIFAISKVIHEAAATSGGNTSAADTKTAVQAMLEAGVELLIYAGGDGTTRDIVEALAAADAADLPLVGVPGGVKMHSGCFAASPKAACEVVAAWLAGDLLVAKTEVMDLDEQAYLQGRWSVKMFGEAATPSSPRWMQGAKMRVEAAGEDDVIEGLSNHLSEVIVTDENHLIIWGSGGTLRTIAENCGFEATLLGIDATRGSEQVGTDLSEKGILDLLDAHGDGSVTLLVSPMGGQGFLLGRGNLQLSPAVLRRIGVDGVLGIVTPAKMLTLTHLRIDTGEAELDALFQAKRYLKVLQGYRTTRLVKVAED